MKTCIQRLSWWLTAACWLGMRGGAGAGVEGTHHDMRLYNPGQEESACVYCHVPHRAQSGDNLFARTGDAEGLGPIGNFCYSCHDGTVVPTAMVEAPDGTLGLEALTGSHGYVIARIEEVTEGVETAGAVLSSGLVDASDSAAPPDTFDCDACHDPHTDQYAPFLRASLEDLCQKCHSGQDGTGRARWTKLEDTGDRNWAHPIGMPVTESGLDNVRGLPSEMSFHGPEPAFDRPTPSSEELKSIQVHWETGGHLVGLEQNVSCATCHSAHLPKENLLVALAASEPEKKQCAGCHSDGVDLENPGATPYYHPVFDSSFPPYVHDHATHGDVGDPNIPTTGEIDLFVEIPVDWPIGDQGQILCETCHRAHRGVPGEKLLRRGPHRDLVICNECHGTGEYSSTVNVHHPVGLNDYTAPEHGGFPEDIAWKEGPELPGDLSDGLQCVDCHTELAKSAHNW